VQYQRGADDNRWHGDMQIRPQRRGRVPSLTPSCRMATGMATALGGGTPSPLIARVVWNY
jgi:hypothetical protein